MNAKLSLERLIVRSFSAKAAMLMEIRLGDFSDQNFMSAGSKFVRHVCMDYVSLYPGRFKRDCE